MERYDGYKESGVDWIGEMPSSWSISKIKYIGSYVNGYAFKPADWSSKGLPIIRIQDLTGSNEAPNRFEGTLDEKYLIEDGDLLVSWAATIGAFRWSGHKGWLNQHIFKVIPNENLCTKKYAYWLFDSSVKELDHANKHGIMMAHLTASVFNSFTVPLPPLNEQDAIAQWLEIEVNRVEKTIDSCLKSVSLLNEYRQSIITEAVTHGLDPSAPMKPSGIEWMGDIPANWQARRVKAVVQRLNVGVVIEPSKYFDDNGTVPFLRGVNIKADGFDLSDLRYITTQSNALLKKSIVHTGDIVVVRDGAPGTALVIPPQLDGANCVSLLELTCASNIKPTYLRYALAANCSQAQFAFLSNGTAIKHLNASELGMIFVTVPLLSEQDEIIAYLDAKTAEIDALIASKERQVELLREYRKSIISEAVTGKFKVPGLE